jgi:uncharacterized protein
LALRGADVEGAVAVTDLSRLQSLLATSEGYIDAHCKLYRDEEDRYLISVAVKAELVVSCQRCLEPIRISVVTDSTLCMIAGEEQMGSLPESLEPLILEDGTADLRSVVEDELLLGLPIVSYHDSGPCADLVEKYYTAAEPDELESQPNPFAVLEQLKND